MAQDRAASVQGVCIRATSLAADGTCATGATASYAMDAFVSATITPNYDQGDEISEKNASGVLCVYYRALDTLKNVTIALSICEPDVELTEILSGGTLLATTEGTNSTLADDIAIGESSFQVVANIGVGAFTIGTGMGQETVVVTGVTGSTTPFTAYTQFPMTKTHAGPATPLLGDAVTAIATNVGWAAPAFGQFPTPNGVALEVWSYAVQSARRAANNQFFRWVLPLCQIEPSGDRVIENGLMANTFSGYGSGNPFFGDGPAHDWVFPSDRAYQYARDNAAPSGVNGYVTVT